MAWAARRARSGDDRSSVVAPEAWMSSPFAASSPADVQPTSAQGDDTAEPADGASPGTAEPADGASPGVAEPADGALPGIGERGILVIERRAAGAHQRTLPRDAQPHQGRRLFQQGRPGGMVAPPGHG